MTCRHGIYLEPIQIALRRLKQSKPRAYHAVRYLLPLGVGMAISSVGAIGILMDGKPFNLNRSTRKTVRAMQFLTGLGLAVCEIDRMSRMLIRSISPFKVVKVCALSKANRPLMTAN